jgi:hypothetical protein
MIDEFIKYYDDIECVNICNDNHGGSFTHIVNSAFKLILLYVIPVMLR